MSKQKSIFTIYDLRFTIRSRLRNRIVNPIPHWLILATYTLLTAIMTWPLARSLTTAIPGDGFDGWQNYWNLWWIKVALVERLQNPFVTDLLYYPTGVELYFHTLNPFNGVTTLPIQLGFGLIPAYNAVVWISWVLGGYGAYLLTRWVLGGGIRDTGYGIRDTVLRAADCGLRTADSGLRTADSWAAFFAGLVFTFAPFHMAHLLGHMQVMALEWIPFYALYLVRATTAARRGSPWLRSALLAGLFLTFTGLCDWYFVLYLIFFTALVLLWQAINALRDWRIARSHSNAISSPQSPISSLQSPVPSPQSPISSLQSLFLPALVAGGIFFVLLSPLLIPMVQAATQYRFMVRPAADLYTFSASLMDFFVPNRLHALLRPASFTWIGNQVAPPSERTISIGYLPLLLTFFAAWRERRRVGFWLICAAFFLLLALGPRIHVGNILPADIPTGNSVVEEWTPYALLNRVVPFMRISRSVSRYALMVQLSLAVVSAMGLASLLKLLARSGSGLRIAIVSGAASILLLGEYWVAPFPLSPPDTPAYYAQLAATDDQRALLNLPMNYDRPGYLLYQTVHKKPLTVAYISRDDPRTLTERAPVLQHFRHLGPDIITDDPVRIGQTVLHDLGVGEVVLDRYKMPGGLERDYTEQLATAIFAGQQARFEDERLTVYEVMPLAQTEPYVVLGEENWGALEEIAGARQRLLSRPSAQLYILHAPPGVTLQIRYHTLADANLTVSAEGLAPQTLPVAPSGDTVNLALPAALQQAERYTLTLEPSRADAVWIESVGLAETDEQWRSTNH